MGAFIPALLGYLVALSMLIGGAYAALDWLVVPENRAAVTEKAPRHAKRSAPTAKNPVPEHGEAEAKGNERTTVVSPAAEQSDQANRKVATTPPSDERKVAAPPPSDEQLKGENTQNSGAAGCSPTGVTAKGEFVFTIGCKDLIQQHPAVETPSSPSVVTAPSYGKSQAAKSANSERTHPDTGEAGGSNNEGASRSSNPKSNVNTARTEPAKSTKSVRMKSFAAAPEHAERTDRSQQQRPMARPGRMAERAEPDWYNALGLR
jgi:hypothetical protein